MIHGTGVPIPLRDLLWRLPELLAGDDPVLLREDMLRRVVDDPRSITALTVSGVLASGLARTRTFEAGRRTAPPPTVIHSLQRARRIFARRLADVLFEAGMIEFHRAMEERGEAHGSMLRIRARPRPRDLMTLRDEIAAALGVSPDRGIRAVAGLVQQAERARDPLARARSLMMSCDAVLPGQPGTRFHLLLFEEYRSGPLAVEQWIDFANEVSKSTVKASALQCASINAASSGAYARAGELDGLASRFQANGVFGPYLSTLHSSLAGDLAAVGRAAATWSQSVVGWQAAIDLLDRQVRNDESLWRLAQQLHPEAVRLVTSTAPGGNVSTLEALLP